MEVRSIAFNIVGKLSCIDDITNKGLSKKDLDTLQLALKIFKENKTVANEAEILESMKVVYHKIQSKKQLSSGMSKIERFLTFIGVYKSAGKILNEAKQTFVQVAVNSSKSIDKLSPEDAQLHDKFNKLIKKFNQEETHLLSDMADQNDKFFQAAQIKSTLRGFQATIASRHEVLLLNNGKGYAQNPGTNFMMQSTGLRIHPEKQDVTNVLKSAPEMLINLYEQAEAAGKLKEFFMQGFDSSAGCLEARMAALTEYQISLEESQVTQNPNPDQPLTIDQNQSVSDNLKIILPKFLDDQIRAFLGQDYTPEKAVDLQGDETFQQQHCHQEAFKNYLSSHGYLDQNASDGPIRDHFDRVSAEFISYGLLEATP